MGKPSRPDWPCKVCKRRTEAKARICTPCRVEKQGGPVKPPPKPCLDCEAPTRAKVQLCRACIAAAKEVVDADVETQETGVDCAPSPTYLCDGRWVPRGGILRWEAA